MATDSHAQRAEDARAQLVRTLLEKINEDTYPSTTMLDFVEELLHEEEVPDYVAFLQQRIADDKYPSIPLIDRLVQLAKPA